MTIVDFAEQREKRAIKRAEKAEAERDALREICLMNGFVGADDQYGAKVAKAPWNSGDWDIHLTPKELAVLNLLFYRAPHTVSKEAILAHVYSEVLDWPEIKIIDVFVCKLRRKLKGFEGSVETVWGEGFRYCAEPAWNNEKIITATQVVRKVLFANEGDWVSVDSLLDILAKEFKKPTSYSFRADLGTTYTAHELWIERNCPKGSRLERKFERTFMEDRNGKLSPHKLITHVRVVIARG